MGKPPAAFSVMKWGFGFSVAHFAVTAALMQLAEASNLALWMGIDATSYGDLIHVVREALFVCLILSNMPLLLVESWFRPISPSIVWPLLAINSLFQGLVAAVVIRWMIEPPKFFVRFRLPFVTRRVVLAGMALATAHFALSISLYFGIRIAANIGTGTGFVHAALNALEVLHPWLELDSWNYDLLKGMNLAAVVAGAFVWGFLVAGAGNWLRRFFLPAVPRS